MLPAVTSADRSVRFAPGTPEKRDKSAASTAISSLGSRGLLDEEFVPPTSDSGPDSPPVSRNPSTSCLVRLTSEQASVLFPRSLRLWREIVEAPYMSNINPADLIAHINGHRRIFGPSLCDLMDRAAAPPPPRLHIRCLSPRRCKEHKENIIREGILPVTLVAIHGLLTGLDNLLPVGRALAPPCQRFVALSPRNYENSPWDADDSSEANQQDLGRALYEERKRPDQPVVGLLGHSLGGTRSMIVALRRPELVDFLIVFDIAPMSYVDQKLRMALRLWMAVPLMLQHRRGAISSVEDADRAIAAVDPWISNVNRKFILPLFSQPGEHKEQMHGLHEEQQQLRGTDTQMFNINYDLCGSDDHLQDLFHWPCELESEPDLHSPRQTDEEVVDTLEHIGSGPEKRRPYYKVRPFTKPALFLRGGRSPKYMPKEAEKAILKFFPNATIKLIDGASHLIHMDKPREVADTIRDWLKQTLLK